MLSKLHRREDGAVLPVTAVYLIVGIGVLALALDLGHIFLVKNELQRVADAAALAGAKPSINDAGELRFNNAYRLVIARK